MKKLKDERNESLLIFSNIGVSFEIDMTFVMLPILPENA